MNYIGEYIRSYRGDMSLRDFADKCEISHTHLDSIEKGIDPRTGKPVKVTVETLKKIANAMNMTINDLLIKSGDVKVEDLTFDNAATIGMNSEVVKIPILGVIKAGIPIEAQENIIGYTDIPKDWVKGGKKFFGLKISGNSMTPNYLEGDTVIFESTNEFNNGDDCAVMVNGDDCTFKKVAKTDEGILLQPYNIGEYELKFYSKEDIIKLPVKIIGVAREYRRKIC